MLEDLRDYGLIWQRKVKRLLRSTFQIVDGFIVLETNYRLYAYTGMRCPQRTAMRSTCISLIPAHRQPTSDCGPESVCVRKMALPKPGGGGDHS